MAVLLGLLIVGVTAGSASAAVLGIPAGKKVGATEEGINPHLQVGVGYGDVSVSFSVSWNDEHGAAWGVYQYGVYDDGIHKFILFSHDSIYKTRGYSTPLIHLSKITYSVRIDMGTTSIHVGYGGGLGGYDISTPYTVLVKEKSSSYWGGSYSKVIVKDDGLLQGLISGIVWE